MLSQTPDMTGAVNRPEPVPAAEKENRRIQRISLPLPVRVEVRIDAKVTWNEITRLSDVSAFGAGFSLKRPIKRGRMVLMTIPMPRQLRSFDYSEPQYKIWGVVRRCISTSKNAQSPEFSIGVAFTGKGPPNGYLDHPSMLYDITQRSSENEGFWHLIPADLQADDSHLDSDYRKQTRLFIPEALRLERVDEDGNIIGVESTVTENISFGGASVFTTMDAKEGSFVRVISDRFNVTILAIVRGARADPNGITRLHLEFIDRFFPLEGIE
jgi:hypothetical protein